MKNNFIKPFRFKEFTVKQDQSAMKIGTDGVLFGAWCANQITPNSILDIGTGTGIIALQMAQRFDAETIDAVEVDEAAYEQAVENFEQSDWGDRLFCYHSSFDDFSNEFSQEGETYDLIVSNPPFYTDHYETKDEARNKARFTTSLTFESLIKGVESILSDQGVFAVIIPYKEEDFFIKIAVNYKLFLQRRCRVKGSLNTEIKRSLLEFSFLKKTIIEENLTIETQRHQYTKEYIDLVKYFYLKM